MIVDSQLGHGQTQGNGRNLIPLFMRRFPHRQKKHLIQVQLLTGCLSQPQMTKMGRVKSPAQ